MPNTVVYSLFSDLVTEDEKSGIAAKLLTFPREEKDFTASVPEFPEINSKVRLQDLVTSDSWEFFRILNLPADWLTRPPAEWNQS